MSRWASSVKDNLSFVLVFHCFECFSFIVWNSVLARWTILVVDGVPASLFMLFYVFRCGLLVAEDALLASQHVLFILRIVYYRFTFAASYLEVVQSIDNLSVD